MISRSPCTEADPASTLPRTSAYRERLHDAWERTSFYVSVRDGTRLAMDLYRPRDDDGPVSTPYPVVWMHTPYLRGTVDDNGEVVLSGNGYMEPRDLTKYGYVVAVVDTRGKGASFGWRRGMQDSTESRDAYDITEWLASQSWCDGNVGMMGCSYVGGSQDNAAISTPPSLKAIFPGATPFDRYDFVSRGGMTAQYHTRPEDPRDLGEGAMPVDEDEDGALLRNAQAEHARNSIMAEIWKDIPFRDDYSETLGSRFWEETSLSTYREAVERRGPVMYRWTGWEDEFSADQFVAWANLRNVVRVLMGPESHCQCAAYPLFNEHLRFFDRYLKGIENGFDDEPAIVYFTYNSDRGREWTTTDEWPVAGTERRPLFLSVGDDGLGLSGDVPDPAVTSFVTDYSVITGSLATPFWPESQHGRGVSFETPPFAEDVRMTGHPVVSLWVCTTATDGDFFAYLEEVAPDGSSHLRCHGRLRASHRSLHTPPYDYLGLPWHRSFREDHRPMVPGVPEQLVFDLLPTSTILRRGSRLRLVITGADPRQRNHLPVDPPPTVTVHTGGERASYVEIPVVSAGG